MLDDDYVGGISNSIANKLNHLTSRKIFTMGLSNKDGFHKHVDNLPQAQNKLQKILKMQKMTINKFKNKKVLIAGGTGIVGRLSPQIKKIWCYDI